MFAVHAHEARDSTDVRIMLVTPEDEPLLLFGGAGDRRRVRILLGEHRIALQTGFTPATAFDGTELHLLRTGRSRRTPSIAMPALRGQPGSTECLRRATGYRRGPTRAGRVGGIQDVYAAGDITNFPVKQGGIATQQADAAAERSIAAAAGASAQAQRRSGLSCRGLLLTGAAPRFLRRDIAAGGHGAVTTRAALVAADEARRPRLAPFLAGLAGTEHRRAVHRL